MNRGNALFTLTLRGHELSFGEFCHVMARISFVGQQRLPYNVLLQLYEKGEVSFTNGTRVMFILTERLDDLLLVHVYERLSTTVAVLNKNTNIDPVTLD